MLKRFLCNIIENFFNLIEESSNKSLEKRSISSVSSDIKDIIELLDPASRLKLRHKIITDGSHVLVLEFYGSVSSVQKQIEDSGINMKMTNHWAVLRESWWRISRNDYLRYFEPSSREFVRGDLTKSLQVLKESKNKSNYTNLMSKYEDTINIISVTLKESLSHNGYIIDEIGEESIKMLKCFVEDLGKVESEETMMKELDSNAVKESLINRLKEEREFVDRFIRNV